MFEKIKHYYDLGIWDLQRVRNAVEKGILSPEQFKDITGLVYEAG